MHSLDIDQLKTFLAVVETESFTLAAERVAKTQSAVSMQIKKLEEMIGKKLFLREGRGVLLNAEGQQLIGFARDIVERSDEALLSFDDTALRGRVYLGTPDDYAERFLPAILAGFSKKNPLVEVSVVCENTSNLAQYIKTGELDVAIVTHTDVMTHSELVREEPYLWVTSASHSTHEKDTIPLALDDCSEQTAVLALTKARIKHRMLCKSSSARIIGSTVSAGLAVSIQPESALRQGMRVLTEKDGFPPLPKCQIGLMRGIRAKTDVTEALIAMIRESLNDRIPLCYSAGDHLVVV